MLYRGSKALVFGAELGQVEAYIAGTDGFETHERYEQKAGGKKS